MSEQSNLETSANLSLQNALAPTWKTIVHNDPINLMSYVQWIFESYFAMSPEVARKKMLQVHHKGRAVVASGNREQMERDAQSMHTYGLWATIEPEAEL
ncbi:MAG: ATP-dependent Clp protease adapter ClpS [Arcanobacterium sp.]|nr:ATP-dependent Clp protease adapter ClpS [Arcanobacterium sp.]